MHYFKLKLRKNRGIEVWASANTEPNAQFWKLSKIEKALTGPLVFI